jgi:cobalt/nickel transport protein
MKNKKWILILAVILPFGLITVFNGFSGTDDMAINAIVSINKGYKPWFQFEGLYAPSSPIMEGIMFSLQAALGVGFIAYFIGRKKNV